MMDDADVATLYRKVFSRSGREDRWVGLFGPGARDSDEMLVGMEPEELPVLRIVGASCNGALTSRRLIFGSSCMHLRDVLSVNLFDSPLAAKRGRGGLAVHSVIGPVVLIEISLGPGGVGLWNVLILIAGRNAVGG